MNFEKILEFLKNRLGEKSTYAGIATLGAVFGLDIFSNPEFVEAFGGTGVLLGQVIASIVALIAVVKKSKGSADAEPTP